MTWLEIISWTILSVLLCLRAIVAVLFALGNHMQKEEAEAQEFPWLAPVYARHILNFLTKARAFGPQHRLKKLSLSITSGIKPDGKQLAAFHRLCQPSRSLEGEQRKDLTRLPLMYFTVQTFALQLSCLANVHYPLSAIGTVMTAYRAVQLKACDSDSAFIFKLELNRNFRMTEKGHVEFDTTVEARREGSGELVWTDVTTYMVKIKRDASQVAASSKPAANDFDFQSWPQQQSWKWTTKAGPQFAKLNGDCNPIHMTPWLARLFGFRSNIAHGQHVMARVLDTIANTGPSAGLGYPQAISAHFQRPVLLPDEVRCSWKQKASGSGLAFGPSTAGLRCMIGSPIEFVVSSAASGKALVLGVWGQGLVASEQN